MLWLDSPSLKGSVLFPISVLINDSRPSMSNSFTFFQDSSSSKRANLAAAIVSLPHGLLCMTILAGIPGVICQRKLKEGVKHMQGEPHFALQKNMQERNNLRPTSGVGKCSILFYNFTDKDGVKEQVNEKGETDV
jgi:hypothetical protein